MRKSIDSIFSGEYTNITFVLAISLLAIIVIIVESRKENGMPFEKGILIVILGIIGTLFMR